MIDIREKMSIQEKYWLVMMSALLIVVCSIGYYFFLDSIDRMLYRWEVSEEYSHGYLIPLIAAYLIYIKLPEFNFNNITQRWVSLPTLLIAASVYWLGNMATIFAVSITGFVIFIWALFIAIFGWNNTRKVVAPLLILLFMVPMPNFLFFNISQKAQLASSELGVMVIRLFDISVFLEGNVIDLGKLKLQVVEACNGLRYLFPLMTLSFILGYIYKGSFLLKAIIFVSSIPIAIIMNSIRIGLIGVTVEYWGIEAAEGVLHDFEGWAMFMACMGVLIFEVFLLNRFFNKKQSLGNTLLLEQKGEVRLSDLKKIKLDFWVLGFALVMLLAGSLKMSIPERVLVIPDRSTFSSFPLTIDGWQGNDEQLGSTFVEALKFDDYFLADYVKNDALINLYIAYYAQQLSGQSVHSPATCLPGNGWVMEEISEKELDLGNGKSLFVNRAIIQKGDQKQLVYYWFEQRGRNLTNEYGVKWYLVKDSILNNRSDGALVRFTTLVQNEISSSEKEMTDLVKNVVGLLPEYVPN